MKLHNLYLVDYENVHQHGLNGISELTEQDHLVIFWGAKCGSLKGDTYMQKLHLPLRALFCFYCFENNKML